MGVSDNGQLPIPAQLEGLLFVAGEPVLLSDLAQVLDVSAGSVEAGLAELESALRERGLRLQRHAGRVQLTTAPQLADSIEKFLGLESKTHLSRAGLETLAMIAYQQPVTRPQIDAVRGVNSDSMLKGLLSKGLIYEMGRGLGPGRPILYATTPEFLQHLGLDSIKDLPAIEMAEPGTSPDEMLKG